MSSLRLILEHAPTPQAMTEIAFHGGDLSVGRGDDADWRIHDPDSFVSRKHFLISGDGDQILVHDASSGGLFVDGSDSPLGQGNSVAVEDGMRLRFGDFVARIEMVGAAKQPDPAPGPGAAASSPFDFSFEPAPEPAPKPERPDDLPEPFGQSSSPFFGAAAEEEDRTPPEPINRDNPFALGLKPAEPEPAASKEDDSGFGDRPFFSDPFGSKTPDPEPAPPKPTGYVQPPDPRPAPTPPVEPPRAVAENDALRDAFFRGLGLNPDDVPTQDAEAEMEALGKRFRILADGITHLLRTRAEEKQRVRVAQTIVGSANVNPLKFAVSAEEAVLSLVRERGKGYLSPDASIDEAFRDLIDHQLRTWSALQTALRRMIDKFDPQSLEQELQETGLLETLMAGGKSAMLWQLYEERYEEIARAAEERFLGEVGAEFRDAYEGKGGT